MGLVCTPLMSRVSVKLLFVTIYNSCSLCKLLSNWYQNTPRHQWWYPSVWCWYWNVVTCDSVTVWQCDSVTVWQPHGQCQSPVLAPPQWQLSVKQSDRDGAECENVPDCRWQTVQSMLHSGKPALMSLWTPIVSHNAERFNVGLNLWENC